MTEEPVKKTKRKFRPIRVTFYLLALCVVIVIVKFFFIYTAEPNIAVNYVEKLNQLTKPDNYDPAQNAAPLYEKAFKAFIEMPADLEDVLNQWGGPNRKWLWPDDLEPDELKKLEDWLQLNEKALDIASLAVEKPYWWITASSSGNWVMKTELSYLTPTEGITEALCWRAMLAVINGDTQSAIIDFRTSQKITNHLRHKPTSVDYLAAGRIRDHVYSSIFLCISRMDVDNTMLMQLQTDLGKMSVSTSSALSSFNFALNTDRILWYDLVQRFFTDNGKGDGHFLLRQWDKEWWGEMYGYRNALSLKKFKEKMEIKTELESRKVTVEKLEKYLSAVSEVAQYTPSQLHSQNTTYKDKIDAAVDLSDNYFLEFTTPALQYMTESVYRNRATYEALDTTIAIFRYKNDKGDYPRSLDQLIEASLLESLPIDPYSDSPLLYKLTDNDFIIYGVGEDFDEDGGIKQYSYRDEDGDNIFWPIPKPKKRELVDMSSMPGMLGMPGMMPPEQPTANDK